MDLYKASRPILYASNGVKVPEALVEFRIIPAKFPIRSLLAVLGHRAPEAFRRTNWLGLGDRAVAPGAGTSVRARCFRGVRCSESDGEYQTFGERCSGH